jgi:hypothetical protein
MEMDKDQIRKLKAKLNLMYDELEKMDLEIDVLTLKRNSLYTQIESGAAILIKYGGEDID